MSADREVSDSSAQGHAVGERQSCTSNPEASGSTALPLDTSKGEQIGKKPKRPPKNKAEDSLSESCILGFCVTRTAPVRGRACRWRDRRACAEGQVLALHVGTERGASARCLGALSPTAQQRHPGKFRCPRHAQSVGRNLGLSSYLLT